MKTMAVKKPQEGDLLLLYGIFEAMKIVKKCITKKEKINYYKNKEKCNAYH